MSISQIKIPTINEIAYTVNESLPGTQANRLSFKEVLHKTSLNPEDLSAIEKSLTSKEQLIETLNDLQIQMSKNLINALSSNAKEEIEIGNNFHLDRFIITSIDSSKNHHTNQNNDVFKVREDLDLIINQAAEAHGVEPALVKSVIKVESNFNPNSTSPKGAMGLMQLMPATANDLGVRNAYDPGENVQAGTRYLKTLLDRYDGNVAMALAAYNWGMGNLEKKPSKMPAETKNYIENVTRYYELAKA